MDWLRNVPDMVKQLGPLIALAFTWGGLIWLFFKRRADWKKKQFLETVNFSLNFVVDDHLVMRTLLELSAHDVWLSPLAVQKVQKAAAKTTEAQPFIHLEDPEDQAFVNRAMLNVLSEKFAETYMAEALGQPVVTDIYRFALTFERHPDMRTLKLRVLVLSQKDIDGRFSPTADPALPPILLRNAFYVPRLETLKAMARIDKASPEDNDFELKLGRVVLGIRKY